MSQYALRLPESLKAAAKRIAAQDDTTMNQFFVVAIAEKISAMETAAFLKTRRPRRRQSSPKSMGQSRPKCADGRRRVARKNKA